MMEATVTRRRRKPFTFLVFFSALVRSPFCQPQCHVLRNTPSPGPSTLGGEVSTTAYWQHPAPRLFLITPFTQSSSQDWPIPDRGQWVLRNLLLLTTAHLAGAEHDEGKVAWLWCLSWLRILVPAFTSSVTLKVKLVPLTLVPSPA